MTELFQTTEQPSEPQIDPNKNYLEELVGEGRKFKTPEDMAKGKHYADEMIKIQNRRMDELIADNKALREETNKKAQLEEMLNSLNQRLASSESTPKANEDNTPKFDPAEIEQLVSRKIHETERTRIQTENLKKAREQLKERFGDNYQTHLKRQADDLGLSEEYVTELAKNSPRAFARTFGLDQQPKENQFQSPPTSRQRSDNFAPTGKRERTWSYYQEMKQKDPLAWLNPKTAIQMQQDAIDMGDKFYDGNFYVPRLHEQT